MGINYKTPGVYVEEISNFPQSVIQVETAIPAFIGFTEKAKKNTDNDLLRIPNKISSFNEYQTYYGSFRAQEIIVTVDKTNLPIKAEVPAPSYYKMYYALKLFFDNGGSTCYIVSVGDYCSEINTETLGNSNSNIPGGLDIIKKTDEVTLIYFPDAHALNAKHYYSLYNNALKQCESLGDRFSIIDVKKDGVAASDPIGYLRGINGLKGSGLKYGAAYWPFLITTMKWGYNNGSVTIKHPNGKLNNLTVNEALSSKSTSNLITKYFLMRMEQEINKINIEMPPGVAISGVYNTVDSSRGVWKAPANISLNNVISPSLSITSKEQENLNVHTSGKSINAIRSFIGEGVLVWGARTLAGNDNEWRYISVRRYFNMVEESVKKATEQFVFEPNNTNTWTRIKAMIENFLAQQWKMGALAGAAPEESFFVKIGLGVTMTQLDIQEGRLIVEIGMAVIRPAEFIILRFSQKMIED